MIIDVAIDVSSGEERRGERTTRRTNFRNAIWSDSLASQFSLDGAGDKVAAGAGSGRGVTLRLSAPSAARRITYLDSKAWSEDNLLRGEDGIAALTFCDVPIALHKPAR